MHPDKYVRPPKCHCKKHKGWRIDKYRVRVERKSNLCRCEGYWFIHAKGRGWCHFNKREPPPGTAAARSVDLEYEKWAKRRQEEDDSIPF